MGHTRAAPTTWATLAVHPHIRGAYRKDIPVGAAVYGSSPHTWGIHGHEPKPRRRPRFIPTYVGHTLPLPPGSTPPSVHPHLRGAYIQLTASVFGVSRFIPTYVGHTCRGPARSRKPAVHPHIRGAYVHVDIFSREPRRFIPTYVGHTYTLARINPRPAVHPHIRGAYMVPALIFRA